MDTLALGNLKLVAPIGAALFGAVAVTTPWVLAATAPQAAPGLVAAVTAWQGLTSVLLVVIHALLRKGAIEARWANPILAGITALVMVGTLLQATVAEQEFRTAVFVLLLLANALFLTSPRWFVAATTVALLVWGSAVAFPPASDLTGLLVVFVAEASVMSVVMFIARYAAIRDLERLHLKDKARARSLEEAIAGRVQAEEEIAQALQERKVIMETVPDLIYRLDADTRLVAWNKQVELVTGARPEELEGRPCAEFIIEQERPLIAGMIQNCIATGLADQEFHLLRRGREPILYQFLKSPIRNGRGEVIGFAGVGRDVSERKAAERRLAAQHAATTVLAEGGPEHETITRVVERVTQALEWRFGAVWIAEEGGDRLLCKGTWSSNDERDDFGMVTRRHAFVRGEGLPGRVWLTEEPAWIEDVWVDANFPRAPTARQEGLHGALAFPIKHSGQTVGVMEFFSDRIESPDPALLRMLSAVGSQIGIFMARKRNEREITSLNAELEARIDDLRAANRDLESFGYTVSHDLRAHLRAIDYFSDLIMEEQAAGRTMEAFSHVARIQHASDRMGEIIEDILELSRAGQRRERRETIDLSAIARSIAADLRAREPARAVDLFLPESLPAEGEPGLLRVVLENLLSNAWKFTRPSAHPRVEVGSFDEGGERVYYVRDNGAGFDMAKADHLFQPFHRLHTEKEFEGTGVGLATVRRIVLRHGGRVWAEAAPGAGATFFFTLAPPEYAAETAQRGPHRSGRTVRQHLTTRPERRSSR